MLPLRVILDPSALAISRIGDNKEEALQYIDALISWDFFRSEPLSSLIISRDSLNALFIDNEYLDQKKLSLKLKQCNVYEHSANDLIPYFYKLTSLNSYLEDENVQITDKEVKIDSVTPAIPENAIGTNLQALFLKTLQSLILEAEQPNERQSILAQHIINSTVIDTTSSLKSHDLNPQISHNRFLLAMDYQDILKHLDIGQFFHSSLNEKTLKITIQFAFDLHNKSTSPSDEIPLYKIGSKFISRLQDLKLQQSILRETIKSMLESLLNLNKASEHRLRRGIGGGTPARKRKLDGAIGMRRDISGEHHLHYWRGVNNLIEFAWISFPHDDMECPE